MRPIFLVRRVAAAALALCMSFAHADERAELEALRATTMRLIELMVAEGLLTREKANELLRQAESAAPPPGEKPKPAVRVPYVPESVLDKLREELREEIVSQAQAERWAEPGRLPLWADRVTITGDVRFRVQHDMLDDGSAPAAFFQALGQNINNATEDRTRLRVRARLGLRASITEGVRAGIGIATGSHGSTGSPNSTNNTLGDYFNRQTVGFDLAYIDWQPPTVEWFGVTGGRMPNPFLSTDMVWASDLRFDGLVGTLRSVVREDFKPYVIIGTFPLRDFEPVPEVNPARRSKWLYGTQAGLEWGYPEGTLLRLGAAHYDYRHIEGVPNAGVAGTPQATLFDWTAAQVRQKGNTVFPINVAGNPTLYGLASRFRIVNLTGELGLRYDEFRRVTLTLDWAENVGFDRAEIAARTGGTLEPQTSAFHGRVAFGHQLIERWGDWFVFGGYKRVERDAVLDAFTDGDQHLGGTNHKGWYLGGGFGIGRNAWLGAKYTTANEIDGPPLAIDVLQLDLNAKF